MYLRGTILRHQPPYVEGIEPRPFEFYVRQYDTVMWGFNFTNEWLYAGREVYMVFDMWQRWVYSSQPSNAFLSHECWLAHGEYKVLHTHWLGGSLHKEDQEIWPLLVAKAKPNIVRIAIHAEKTHTHQTAITVKVPVEHWIVDDSPEGTSTGMYHVCHWRALSGHMEIADRLEIVCERVVFERSLTLGVADITEDDLLEYKASWTRRDLERVIFAPPICEDDIDVINGRMRPSWTMCKELGRIEEPVVSSPYRMYEPKFARTDKRGAIMNRATSLRDPGYIHHLSAGTARMFDRTYAPIQATWYGGEPWVDGDGEMNYHRRGTLRYTPDGRPVYLRRRMVDAGQSDPDEQDVGRYFAGHEDYFMVHVLSGITPTNAFLQRLATDSPFKMMYLLGQDGVADGPQIFADANFDIKALPFMGFFPEEWELTTDHRRAQWNYDVVVSPGLADGEALVPGEVLCFERKKACVRVPLYNDDGTLATAINPDTEEEEFIFTDVCYMYYEAEPVPSYWEPLRGQGITESFFYETFPEYVEEVTVSQMGRINVYEYARLMLGVGADDVATNLPGMHNEEVVCRLCEYSPSRGVFLKIDENGIRYPVMGTPDTSEGYGIPVATLHRGFNEVTSECEDVVEHARRRMLRIGHELMIVAERECWRACGKIDGTIPPVLGDPSRVDKRWVYVEFTTNVEGDFPNISSLSHGTCLNLTTGQVFDC